MISFQEAKDAFMEAYVIWSRAEREELVLEVDRAWQLYVQARDTYLIRCLLREYN